MQKHTVALIAIVMLVASALSVSDITQARETGYDRTQGREARSGEVERIRVQAINGAQDRRQRAIEASVELAEQHRARAERIRDNYVPVDTVDEEETSTDAPQEEDGNAPVTTPAESTEEAETIPEPADERPDPTEEETERSEDEPDQRDPEPNEEVSEPELVVEEPTEQDEEAQQDANDYLDAIAREIHRLTNIERARAGVDLLESDSALAVIAQGHSVDMAENGYFSHTSPDGCGPSCRMDEAGYESGAWGENIAWRRSSSLPSAAELAVRFVESWMNSDGHRRNMLSEKFTHEGVGIARDGDTIYATVDFADPR